MVALPKLGIDLRVATPKGYEPLEDVVEIARNSAKEGDAQRVGETAQRIREALQAEPQQALAISAHDTDKPFPDVEAMETKLEKLRRERETLGGVNLRAEEGMPTWRVASSSTTTMRWSSILESIAVYCCAMCSSATPVITAG